MLRTVIETIDNTLSSDKLEECEEDDDDDDDVDDDDDDDDGRV